MNYFSSVYLVFMKKFPYEFQQKKNESVIENENIFECLKKEIMFKIERKTKKYPVYGMFY